MKVSRVGQGMKIFRLIPSLDSDQMAMVKTSSHDAILLEKSNRMVVGHVRSYVRRKEVKLRCYRCHRFGHIGAAKARTDSNCAWRAEELDIRRGTATVPKLL